MIISKIERRIEEALLSILLIALYYSFFRLIVIVIINSINSE
jgi:hypothetical protein